MIPQNVSRLPDRAQHVQRVRREIEAGTSAAVVEYSLEVELGSLKC